MLESAIGRYVSREMVQERADSGPDLRAFSSEVGPGLRPKMRPYHSVVPAACGTTPPQERYCCFLAFALVAALGAAGAGAGLRLGCAFGAPGTSARAAGSSG